jgi:hypothetical protein
VAGHRARGRIVDGFLDSREYVQVLYMVNSVPLARRLVGLIDDGTMHRSGHAAKMFNMDPTDMRVLAWQGADEATRVGIEAAIAKVRPRRLAAA